MNKILSANQILKNTDKMNLDHTTRVRAGKINRNIAFELRKEQGDKALFHLVIVEYKPSDKSIVFLEGHGLNSVILDEAEERIMDLKFMYHHVALEIGTRIQFTQGRLKKAKGEIVEVQRAYRWLDIDGYSFDPDGLTTTEDMIKHFSGTVDYEFDGYTLKVHHPEKEYRNFISKAETRVSTFFGYHYTIKVDPEYIPATIGGDTYLVSILYTGIKPIKE